MAGAGQGLEKVTRLSSRRPERPADPQPRVLERLRGLYQQNVRGALPGLLDEMDDRLYELVERSASNQLQTHYFEVMRELRLVRTDIEARFMRELEAAVDERIAAAVARQAVETDDGAPSGLSLMNEEELEEGVAVTNIATKIRNQCQQELFALDRRMAAVLAAPGLEGDANPFAPETIAGAASQALHEVDTSIDVRIVLLKLVERALVSSAAGAYAAMNELLVSLGVLPNVRSGIVHRGDPRRPARPGTSAPEAGSAPAATPGTSPSTAPGDLSGQWVQHAARQMSTQPDTGAPGAGGSPAPWNPAGAPGGGLPADPASLAMLHTMMTLAGAQGMNAAAGPASQSSLIDGMSSMQREDMPVGGGASMLRELRTRPLAEHLSQVDDLMIDVVAMMFDYILEDDAIVDSMRTQIARLQIPALKVAILDKTFFARRTHPARRLVNELAAVGGKMQAATGRGDPVFDRIEALIDRILAEFESDLDVFSGALEELREVVEEEERDARQSAWRSTQVVRERERLEACRKQASEEVETRLAGQEVPDFIAEFLRSHWRHLLATRLYQDGEDSKAWRGLIQTMDNLVWSVCTKSAAGDRDRLLAMLPFLLHRLKSGMADLGLGRTQRRDFLRTLSTHHITVVRGDVAPPVPVPEPVPAPGTAASAAEAPGGPIDPTADAAGAEWATPVDPLEDAAQHLRSALEEANALVFSTAQDKPQCKGMGTTAVALKFVDGHAVCAHVGDSRIYRLRGADLAQLTRDHTYRQQLLDLGKITEEEAHTVASNLIVRAIGIDGAVKVDSSPHELADGDVFLLCSDGLSDMLDDGQILALMLERDAAHGDLTALSHALVAAANDAGGRDNVSVALARVASSGAAGWTVELAQATHAGRVRPHNEDCVEICARRKLLVLADGMGGHNAGEVASAMTVRVTMNAYTVQEDDAESAATPAETSTASSQGGFDFEAINAAFWDEAVRADEAGAGPDIPGMEAITVASGSLDDLLEPAASSEGGMSQDASVDPCLAAVLKLSEGDWVEFRPSAGPMLRARVSYVTPDRARILFTGRRGQKIADASAYGLALELRNERLRLLDSAPLLDRAMSHLSARLRAHGPPQEPAATH